MEADTGLEQLMGYLGEFGPYQKKQFFFHLLTGLTAGINMISLVTVAAVPAHRCMIPGELANNTLPWNSSEVTHWIPPKDDGLDNCHIYVNGTNETEKCNHWVYDDAYYPSSRTIEWNMVCDQRWMGAIAQTAYMLGVLTGAIVMGSLSDKFGRKKVFYLSCVLQFFFATVVAFIPEYYTFLVIRYFYGIFGSAGAYNTAFVMTMELVGSSKRTPCGLSFQAAFAFGMILVSFWGWLVPDRMLQQLIYAAHSALLLGHWWLVDESPRWLWAHGRQDEAIEIIKKAIKANGDSIPIDKNLILRDEFPEESQYDEGEEGGILSLIRTPNLRKRTINVCLNWFANSLAYYGLSLNTGALPGNPFLMLFVIAAIELPSYVLTAYLMDRLGRRNVLAFFMMAGGIACIVSVFIPTDDTAGRMGVIGVVMLGKLLLAGSFAIIFNYTAELFPTMVRNTAIGIGSMHARLSGAMTPLISLLDSLNKTLPILIFASIALISGFFSLFLPETLNQPMPQSMEDGENFGKGDTAFRSCCGKKKEGYTVPIAMSTTH